MAIDRPKSTISKYLKEQQGTDETPSPEPLPNTMPNTNTQQPIQTEPNKKELQFLYGFGIPAVIISLFSAVHLVDFFMIGNTAFMSWCLAFAFEFAVVGMLIGLSVLKRLNVSIIVFMLVLIYILQVIGNVYSVYINFTPNYQIVLEFFNFGWIKLNKFWISFLVGAFLPTVSFLMMKSIATYFDNEWMDKSYKKR